MMQKKFYPSRMVLSWHLFAFVILLCWNSRSRAIIYQQTNNYQQPNYESSQNSNGTLVPANEQQFIIPFRYDPPTLPLIVIELSINKSEHLRFIVDTGWGPTLSVLPSVAQKIKLQATGEEIRFQPGNILNRASQPCDVEIFAQSGTNVTFQVQKAWIGDLPILKSLPDQHIAGILGGELFRALISRFDFDTKTLTLFHASHPAIEAPAGATVLLTYRILGSSVPHVMLTPAGNGMTDFVVDTGSNSTTLPDTLADKLQNVAVADSMLENIAESRVVHEVLLSELVLGTRVERLTPVLLEPVSMLPPAVKGLLGLDVLSRFRFTIDPKGGKLILEPRPNYIPRLPGETGLQLEIRKGNAYISKVTSPSLFAQGIEIGDRVVAIDGQEVKGLDWRTTTVQLSGWEGTLAMLTLEKPGHQMITVNVKRRSHFPSLIHTTFGLTLTKEANSEAHVVDVERNTPAERAGIKRDDEIITINDVAVRSQSAEEIHTLFESQKPAEPGGKTITIRCKRDTRIFTYIIQSWRSTSILMTAPRMSAPEPIRMERSRPSDTTTATN